MSPSQFKYYIIRPCLHDMKQYSPEAEEIVLGTGLVESNLEYVHQIGGPALGPYQMEPATHDDHWRWLASSNHELFELLNRVLNAVHSRHEQLIYNLWYATAMCRVHYLRVPMPIPEGLHGQAAYWKQYYNTPLGKGTTERYLQVWKQNRADQLAEV